MDFFLNLFQKKSGSIALFFCLCLFGAGLPVFAQPVDTVDETEAERRAVAAMLEGGTVFILTQPKNIMQLGMGMDRSEKGGAAG